LRYHKGWWFYDNSEYELDKEVVGFFESNFKVEKNLIIFYQLDVLKNYPIMFSKEGHKASYPVTLAEIQSTLKGFSS